MAFSAVCKLWTFAIIGLVLLGIGIGSIFVINSVIRDEINKQVVLTADSETYSAWVNPPAEVYLQFWVFHVENPYEIVHRGDKPALKEKGPYSYREVKTKEDVKFHDNGTVTYRETRTMYFDPDTSRGSQDEVLTVVNLPYVTVATLLRFEYDIIKDLVQDILKATNETLFIKLSPRQLIWGYEDTLLKDIKMGLKKYFNFTLPLDDTIGLFYKQNGSDDGVYNIYTGKTDPSLFNTINLWNYSSVLDYWTTPEANAINGTDGTFFHPFITKDETLELFSTDICRSIGAIYEQEMTVLGINTYRFVVPKQILQDYIHYPPNIGFCTPDVSRCLGAGLLNATVCKQGQPAIVSLPHFYQGDQSLVDAFDGLHPTKDVHQTFLDVEPYTGALLRASKRLQVNIWLQKISRFTETDHLPDFLPFPVMWLNESALVEESTADELKSQLLTVIKVSQGGEYAVIAIGSIMVLVVICIAIFRCQRQRDDQLLHSVNTDDRSDYGAVGSRENTYNNGHSTQM